MCGFFFMDGVFSKIYYGNELFISKSRYRIQILTF